MNGRSGGNAGLRGAELDDHRVGFVVLLAQPPAAIEHPDQLTAAAADWLPAAVPGTVAAALEASGRWNWDQPVDIDAHDWWFRTSFPMPELPAGQLCHLSFDGLATLAESG